MNIQIISNNKKNYTDNIVVSSLSEPKSLDMFDINFIDLSSYSIWFNEKDSFESINCINDFKSIKIMINKSKKSSIVFLLPKNYTLNYYSGGTSKYYKNVKLKDMLDVLVKNILCYIIPNCFVDYSLWYEITTTTIGNVQYSADFYIESSCSVKSISDRSKKITTISKNDRFILTTLDVLNSQESMLNYISYLFPKNISFPQWIKDYEFYNDEANKNEIEEKNKEIEAAKKIIEKCNTHLSDNLKYKSILCSNGAALVSVVLEILGKLLSYDFSEFIDEKKEDFLCELSGVTFVGEIKGVTSNVKYEHVTQVEVHRSKYLDKLKEENRVEKTKAILIINPMRNKPLSEREPINDEQIDLAEKFGSLIITTEVLLKIFEKYLNGELSNERIISVFESRTGLLPTKAFYESKEKVDNSAYKV